LATRTPQKKEATVSHEETGTHQPQWSVVPTSVDEGVKLPTRVSRVSSRLRNKREDTRKGREVCERNKSHTKAQKELKSKKC